MLTTSPGQTIEIKKIRHREQDALGIFFPIDTADSQRIRIPQHRPYSATLQGWYLPYRQIQVDVLLMGDAAPGRSFSSLEKPGSGTIAGVPAQDDHTGISSIAVEPSARALTGGKPIAADIQEEKDERVDMAFTNRPFSVRMMMLRNTLKSLPGYYFLKPAVNKNRSDPQVETTLGNRFDKKPQ